MTEAERWRGVVGWEDLYEVSDLGRVRSLVRTTVDSIGRSRVWPSKVLSAAFMKSGHRRVSLCRDSAPVSVLVHRLVLEAFVGPCPKGRQGCHDDGNPDNNEVTNLCWDTPSTNRYDCVRHGRHPCATRVKCPRKHRLAAPNLVAAAARLGHRNCLACCRARAYVQRHPGEDIRVVADRYYAEIMQGATN